MSEISIRGAYVDFQIEVERMAILVNALYARIASLPKHVNLDY